MAADADHVNRLERMVCQRNSELEELNEKLRKLDKQVLYWTDQCVCVLLIELMCRGVWPLVVVTTQMHLLVSETVYSIPGARAETN